MGEAVGATTLVTILMAFSSMGRTLRGASLIEAAAHEEVKKLAKRWQESKQLPLKEADEYAAQEVVLMEDAIVNPDLAEPLRMELWAERLRIGASLRFHDLLHSSPEDLQMDAAGVLFGRCRLTKSESRNRARAWACVDEPLGASSLWLQMGLDLLKQSLLTLPRDFILLKPTKDFSGYAYAPQDREDHSLIIMGFLAKAGLSQRRLDCISGHSAKVTLLSWGMHQGESLVALVPQGGWKPQREMAMPLKYTRKTMGLSAAATRRIIIAARTGAWVAPPEKFYLFREEADTLPWVHPDEESTMVRALETQDEDPDSLAATSVPQDNGTDALPYILNVETGKLHKCNDKFAHDVDGGPRTACPSGSGLDPSTWRLGYNLIFSGQGPATGVSQWCKGCFFIGKPNG